VDKRLQFYIRHGKMYGSYLFYPQFTRKHHPFETHVAQPLHLPGRAVVALCGSVQTDRRKIAIEQVQILNDKGIDTYFI
jgi:hypothetical protein